MASDSSFMTGCGEWVGVVSGPRPWRPGLRRCYYRTTGPHGARGAAAMGPCNESCGVAPKLCAWIRYGTRHTAHMGVTGAARSARRHPGHPPEAVLLLLYQHTIALVTVACNQSTRTLRPAPISAHSSDHDQSTVRQVDPKKTSCTGCTRVPPPGTQLRAAQCPPPARRERP